MTLLKTTTGASNRASVWEWAQAALLVINLVWTTLCLGGFVAQAMVVTSALGGALIVVHLLERAARASRRAPDTNITLPALHPAGWLLLPFPAYAAMNVVWVSPVPWLGWMDWLAWAQIAAVFWVGLNGIRSRAPRLFLFYSLVGLGCALVVLASYQRFVAPDWLMLGRTQATQFLGRSSGSFGSPNSLAAFLLLLLPALGALTIRRRATAAQRLMWGYLTVVFALGIALTISRGAWLALGIVLAVCPIVAVHGSARRRVAYLAGSWVGLAVLAVTIYATVPAVRARIDLLKTQSGELSRPVMWRAAWSIFRDAPVFGGGAGSFSVRFDQHRPESFQLEARWAHNDYLNTLSDYGVVGFGLLFGAWSAVIVGCARHKHLAATDWFDNSTVTVGMGAGMAAFALQLVVDSSLKIPALGMAFAMLTAMVVQRAWPVSIRASASPEKSSRGKWSAFMAAGAASATLLVVVPFYRGEVKRQSARREIDRMALGGVEPQAGLLRSARSELIEATKLAPRNGRAWADLAYVTTALIRFDISNATELGREAEQAANRALRLSDDVAEFWLRKGVAVDMQGRWVEAGGAFVQALQLAPTRAGVWYQQAVHLSLNPVEQERALAAAEVALRLDPGNPEAHALQQRLAERSHAP